MPSFPGIMFQNTVNCWTSRSNLPHNIQHVVWLVRRMWNDVVQSGSQTVSSAKKYITTRVLSDKLVPILTWDHHSNELGASLCCSVGGNQKALLFRRGHAYHSQMLYVQRLWSEDGEMAAGMVSWAPQVHVATMYVHSDLISWCGLWHLLVLAPSLSP